MLSGFQFSLKMSGLSVFFIDCDLPFFIFYNFFYIQFTFIVYLLATPPVDLLLCAQRDKPVIFFIEISNLCCLQRYWIIHNSWSIAPMNFAENCPKVFGSQSPLSLSLSKVWLQQWFLVFYINFTNPILIL